MPSDIRTEAHNALHARAGHPLRFWKRTRLKVEAAEQALDRVDRLAVFTDEPPVRHTVALARAAEATLLDDKRRLAVLREALSVVEVGAAAGTAALGAIAVRLLHAATDGQPKAEQEPTAQSLLDTVRASDPHPYLRYVRHLSGAEGGPLWGLEKSAEPPSPDAAAAATLALTPPMGQSHVLRVALDELPLMFPADTALQSQLARRGEIQSLRLSVPLLDAADRLTVEAIARGQEADTSQAPAFANSAMTRAGGGDAALSEWALRQVQGTPQARPWFEFRDSLAAVVSKPDALRASLVSALAEGRPFNPQTAAAAACRIAKGEDNPQKQLEVAKSVAAWLKQQALAQGNFDLALKSHFLTLTAGLPFASEAGQAAALMAGLDSIAQGTPNGCEGLSRQAVRMAAHTDAFADKYRLANMALQQTELLTEHLGTPQQLEVVRTLRRMSEQEDEPVSKSPNRVWFHAAASLQALQSTSKLVRGTPDELVAVGLQRMETPWASRAYLLNVGEAVLGGIERLGGADSIYKMWADDTRANVQRAKSGADKLSALRRGLTEIGRLQAGGFQKAFEQALHGRDGEAPRIEQEAAFVVINGVKVPRASAEPKIEVPAEPLPAETEMPSLPPQREDLGKLLLPAYQPATSIEQPGGVSAVQSKASYKSGEAGVFNPLSGQTEWREAYKSGIAGVYNPNSGQVVWKSSYKSGVSGAYHPPSGEIAWQESYSSGVGMAYNPTTQTVESKSSYKSGVLGVYNPNTLQVEWREGYKEGVGGYWDQKEEKVVWRNSYKDGIAQVNSDPTCPTLSSSSIGWWDDDD